MTPKQIERVQKKIKSIRATLAAEKRKFGCYDDSAGRRYLPPALYLKIEDYKGGMIYFRLFAKNFPDDMGWPDFLFEWTVVLFKVGKLKEAERKAMETHFSNTYVLDRFLGRPLDKTEKHEWGGWEKADFLELFSYSREDTRLADFAEWLEGFLDSEAFRGVRDRFLDAQRRLLDCKDDARRRELLEVVRELKREEKN